MSEAQDNGSQTAETPASADQAQSGCAGGCCTPPTAQQVMRREAMTLVRRGHSFIEGTEIEKASLMLTAAAVLISEADGAHDSEESIWLQTAEIALYQKIGENDTALAKAYNAYSEAKRLKGETHPMVFVMLGNLGEITMDAEDREKGRKLLRDAIAGFAATEPVGEYTREYMDGIAASMQQVHDRPEPQATPASCPTDSTEGDCCGGKGGDACCGGKNEGCGCSK